ncbi:TldD protein [Paenalcaligenes hominis]|uniref:TldD protein n=1 Tax=Paenalcaligenes hominis TaxID=643674 RepID=A0ABX0WNN8_9BURK|nr:metalloprotease TldD [Paenalcaligenes hominis]NJB63918.1 TldD protein [Paenalcaligenes hominis]GGE61687.1 peptidase C69 [Paenalcaligenes hominis]
MMTSPSALDALSTAKSVLLTPWGVTEHDLQHSLAEIFTHRVDYADLYFQYSRSEAWSLEEGIVKTGSFNIEQGVGVRAISGEKTAFSYSDILSQEALLNAAHAVRSIARQGQQGQIPLLNARPSTRPLLYVPNDPLDSLTAPEKVALLEKVERMARAKDPQVIQVMASLGATCDTVLVAGSDGRLAADVRPLVRLSITVIAERAGRRESGSSGGGGRFDLGYFDDALLQNYVDQAVDQALINLEAKPAPAGEMPVVLGAGWPGILLHEAVGHGLEGDFNRKGSSVFSDRIGEQVASKGVTVIDDGTLTDRRGSLNIDDEGNPTQHNVLIEDGILTGYMQDMLNARLMNMPVTGNGRRESYAYLPMPRMTNTYMLNGSHHPDELIASVKKGIYAANFGGGQVDITSGKFVFSASEAWLIENGKLVHPVKGATLIGSGIEAMNQVSMIANNMALDSGVGTCGKDGQSVPVGVGMPSIRIDGLTVGGTA